MTNAPSPSPPTAATMRGSQSSNSTTDTSFESSFQLAQPYTVQAPESERHPKGKRKRTTSQDKKILEAAYVANPKPDRVARLEIVDKVSLNEKEVQIWFQNRRQNDRRKTRPLSPMEVVALSRNGATRNSIMSSNAAAAAPAPELYGKPEGADLREETRGESVMTSPTPDAVSQVSPKSMPADSSNAMDDISNPQTRRKSDSDMLPSSSFASDMAKNSGPLSQSFSSSIGYLSNRWNTGNSSTPATLHQTGDDSFRLDSIPPSAGSTANSPRASILPPPSTSSSQFRLSLSLEGKAELVSSLQSPPRATAHPSRLSLDAATLPPVRAPRTLQRSRSSLPNVTLPSISTLTASLNSSLPPQLTRGRSRHAHAWEACCEPGTRDELTTQAENESSGSAIAAISLLRSSSSSASLSNLVHNHNSSILSTSPPAALTNILQPNNSKRNAAAPTKRDPKKAKLSRSSSSVARMQNHHQHATTTSVFAKATSPNELEPEMKKSNKVSLSTILSPSGDSDKENWSPDEDGNPSHQRRRPAATALPPSTKTHQAPSGGNPRRVGRVFGEQAVNKRTLLGSRAYTAPHQRTRGSKGIDAVISVFEDGNETDNENEPPAKREKKGGEDAEVQLFMRGGDISPSKRPEMDCAGHLLALKWGK